MPVDQMPFEGPNGIGGGGGGGGCEVGQSSLGMHN